MVPSRSFDKADKIPVRRFSHAKLPGMENEDAVVHVTCPKVLLGDDSAFAFYMHEDSLLPVIKQGVLMYCSRRHDPGPGDMAVLVLKSNGAVVRIITDISEEGLGTVHMTQKGDWTVSAVRDVVPFEDLDEIALVIATSRFTI